MVATATDKRGLKRICMSCSTRFYDFNKRPIICPNCETEFTGDMKIKTRRTRIANDDDTARKSFVDDTEMETIKDVEVDEDEVEAEAETVSLDDVEEDEDDADEEETLDADLDIDDDVEDDLDDEDDDEDDDLDEDEEDEE